MSEFDVFVATVLDVEDPQYENIVYVIVHRLAPLGRLDVNLMARVATVTGRFYRHYAPCCGGGGGVVVAVLWVVLLF